MVKWCKNNGLKFFSQALVGQKAWLRCNKFAILEYTEEIANQ